MIHFGVSICGHGTTTHVRRFKGLAAQLKVCRVAPQDPKHALCVQERQRLFRVNRERGGLHKMFRSAFLAGYVVGASVAAFLVFVYVPTSVVVRARPPRGNDTAYPSGLREMRLYTAQLTCLDARLSTHDVVALGDGVHWHAYDGRNGRPLAIARPSSDGDYDLRVCGLGQWTRTPATRRGNFVHFRNVGTLIVPESFRFE